LTLTKNIPKELLSRGKLLPANYQIKNNKIENLFEEIFSNFKENDNTHTGEIDNNQIINSPNFENNINKDHFYNYNSDKINNNNNNILDLFTTNNTENNNNKTISSFNLINFEVDNLNINENHNNNIKQKEKIDLFDFNNKKENNNYDKNQNQICLPCSDKFFSESGEKQKVFDLNDENLDLNFLSRNDNTEKRLISDEVNKEKDKEDNNNYAFPCINIVNEIQDIQEKKIVDPLDFFVDDLIKNNSNQSHKTITRNPFSLKPDSIETDFSKEEKNKHEITNQTTSYLNFTIVNDENQNLLKDNNNDADPFQASGIDGNYLDYKENQSINNIGDINDFFSYAEALEQKHNDFNINGDQDQYAEPMDYRKSLEANKIENNKKKLEKLFYNDTLLKKFNLKITQDRYDNELIEIFLNVKNLIILEFKLIYNFYPFYHLFRYYDFY